MTLRRALIVAGALALSACATVNSTPDAPQVTQSDRARGAQAHQQILAEFGGAVQGPTAAYVARVGERIAQVANVPGQCTFTLVNSDVPNAFAVPGCYIYVTRGLLAIMNSEDELASVLGHELGHVVADHSDKRQNRATLTTLGAILAGVATGNAEIAQTAGQLGQLYTLSFSREQEFESDDLGVRYLAAAGYDAFAAADMLNSLGAQDALAVKTANRNEGQQIPAWARTHPLSADRVARARAQAAASGAQPGVPPEQVDPYLSAIDGLIYGDDPEQGFVMGRRFAHPKLKIAFEAPEGFTLTNSPQAVLIQGPQGRAQFGGAALPAGGAAAHAEAVLRGVLGETPAQVGQITRTQINGLDAAILPARAQTQQGQIVDLQVAAYAVGTSAYHVVALTPAGGGAAFGPLIRSVRALTDAEAASLKPRVIQVVTAGPRDTVQSLAARMAFDDFRTERFLALNGLSEGANVRAGQRVKLVVMGR